MSTVIGSVTAISGLVVAIDADGVERTLALGDAIMEQDLIRPSMDAQIEISLDNASEPIQLNGGQNWLATADTFTPASNFPADNAVADVDAMQAALLAGQDPTEILEPTAAGAPAAGGAAAGGGNEGADFVQLSRTAGETTPEAGYDTQGLGYTPPPVAPETALIVDEPAPEPPPAAPPAPEPEPQPQPEPEPEPQPEPEPEPQPEPEPEPQPEPEPEPQPEPEPEPQPEPEPEPQPEPEPEPEPDVVVTLQLFAIVDGERVAVNTIHEPGYGETEEGSEGEVPVYPTSGTYIVLAVDGSGEPLPTQPGGIVTVNIGAEGDTAGIEDYSPVTSLPATVGVEFFVGADDDALADNDEFFTLSLGNDWTNPVAADVVNYVADNVTTTILDETNNDNSNEPPGEGDNDIAYTLKLFGVGADGGYVDASTISEELQDSAEYIVLAVDAAGDPLPDEQQPEGTVTVSFTNNDPTSSGDYTTTVSGPVEVGESFFSTAVDDFYADNGETFTVTLDAGSFNNADDFEAISYSDASVTTTIIDETADDNPDDSSSYANNDSPFMLMIVASDEVGNPLTDEEGEYILANTISEAGPTSAHYVVLAIDENGNEVDPGGTVEVSFTNNDPTTDADYTTSPLTASVTVGAVFSSTAVPDGVDDSGETFNVALVAGTYSEDAANVNNDGTPLYETVEYSEDEVVTTINDLVNPLGGSEDSLFLNEAIDEDSDPGSLSFTAGSYALSSFAFSSDLTALNTYSGLLSWSRESNTEIVGKTDGNTIITLTLTASAIAAGVTGSVSIDAVLASGANLIHPGEVSGPEALDLGSIAVVASDGITPDVTGSVSLTLQDDIIEITDLGNANLANAINATASGDLEVDAGVDGMDNLIFSVGGDMPSLKTSAGKDVTFNQLADGSLQAVDSDNDQVFLLEADDGSGYTLTLSQMIEAPTISEDITITTDTLKAGSPIAGGFQVTVEGIDINVTSAGGAVYPSSDGYGVGNTDIDTGESLAFSLDDPSGVFSGLSIKVGNFTTAGQDDTFYYQRFLNGVAVDTDPVAVPATSNNASTEEVINIPDSSQGFDAVVISGDDFRIISFDASVEVVSSLDTFLDFAVDVKDNDGDVHGGDFQVAVDTSGDGQYVTLDNPTLDTLVTTPPDVDS